MLGMLHKTNTITGASHLGAKPFIHILTSKLSSCSKAIHISPAALRALRDSWRFCEFHWRPQLVTIDSYGHATVATIKCHRPHMHIKLWQRTAGCDERHECLW